MITLQFSTTKHISSKAIQFFTWSWASHVDFVLPNGKLFGALATQDGGGVRLHDAENYTRIERFQVDAPESIIDIAMTQDGGGVRLHDAENYTRIERFQVDAPESIIDIAMTQEGKPYDWAGIFGLVLRERNWEDDDKWFCSELVAWSFKQGGFPLLNETTSRITPRDLLISPLLKPIPYK
jgi:hypothetical protein